jgi:hypothetical protein
MSGDVEGDPCSLTGGTCSMDGKASISCVNGLAHVIQCLGPRGCHVDGDRYLCDHSIANFGDACTEGNACTADGKSMLKCKDGAFAMLSACGGPKACATVPGATLTVVCDGSIGKPGDVCTEGAACTAGGKEFLTCVDGKLVSKTPCRGPHGCETKGDQVHCDQSLAIVGDPCEGEGGACSVDKKALLQCKKGVYAVLQKCNCVEEATRVRCR